MKQQEGKWYDSIDFPNNLQGSRHEHSSFIISIHDPLSKEALMLLEIALSHFFEQLAVNFEITKKD